MAENDLPDHGEPEVVFEGPMMEVDIVRSMLAARGIDTFIENENAATTYPFGARFGVPRVRLVCPSECVDEARALIRQARDEEE